MKKSIREGAALKGGVPNGDPFSPGHPTTPTRDAERVRALAFAEGYNLAGIADPGPHPEHRNLASFVERGYAGTMRYLVDRAEERMDPTLLAPWVKSALVVGLFYQTPYPHTKEALAEAEHAGATGDERPLWISRYAWGRDYHRVMTKMNRRLVRKLREAFGHDRQFRQYVDAGPVMEKVLARYAGLGWIGKNTMLISPTAGSWFFLGVVFTDLELATGETIEDHCGSCRKCLDICPTNAFPQPFVLDAERCISYRSIETRDDELPADLKEGFGAHLFGCDLCQDVCPFNHRSPMSILPDFQPRQPGFVPRAGEIKELLADPEKLEARLRGTPLGRAGKKGLTRTLGWLESATEEP
jgi:epoxyqueuosine reductase